MLFSNTEIGLPYIGAKWVGSPTHRKVSVITMVNGAEFIVPWVQAWSIDYITQLKDIDGNTIHINQRNILYVRDLVMWSAKAKNFDNTAYDEGMEKEYAGLLKEGQTVKLIDEYNSKTSAYERKEICGK